MWVSQTSCLKEWRLWQGSGLVHRPCFRAAHTVSLSSPHLWHVGRLELVLYQAFPVEALKARREEVSRCVRAPLPPACRPAAPLAPEALTANQGWALSSATPPAAQPNRLAGLRTSRRLMRSLSSCGAKAAGKQPFGAWAAGR